MRILWLKQAILTNFRSIKSLVIDFSEETWIKGHNRRGKSTIKNAHRWLWSGRDAGGENYELKPLFNGESEDRVSVTVEEIYDVINEDGVVYELKLKRIFLEVWGPDEDGVDTHLRDTTEYWINDDKQKTETIWKQRLAELVDPEAFLILSDPEYVLDKNHTELRKILLKLAGGEIKNEEILATHPQFAKLIEALSVKKYDVYKSEIAGQIKALKSQKKDIPVQIERSLAARPEELNWEEIEAEIQSKQIELDAVNTKIFAASQGAEFDAFKEKQEKLPTLKLALREVETKFREDKLDRQSKINERKNPLIKIIADLDTQISGLKLTIKREEVSLPVLKSELEKLGEEYDLEDAKVFQTKPEDTICPECGNELKDGPAKIAQMEADFNKKKVDKLIAVDAKGVAKKQQVDDLEKSIADNKTKLEELESDRKSNQSALDLIKDDEAKVEDTKEHKAAVKAISDLELELLSPPQVDNSELESNKKAITDEISALNQKLGVRKTIEDDKLRVERDKVALAAVNQNLMKYEKSKLLLEQYSMVRSSMLQEKVNKMFNGLQFQLFRKKRDGELEEICRPTWNNIPYKVVNTADRVAMFIELVNTFQEHYGVIIPVFLDNRESTHEIPATKSQVVNIQFVPNMPLTIEN